MRRFTKYIGFFLIALGLNIILCFVVPPIVLVIISGAVMIYFGFCYLR